MASIPITTATKTGIQIYAHHLLDSVPGNTSPKQTTKARAAALKLLRPHLPTSLPLYRRLQFGDFLPESYVLTNIVRFEAAAAEGETELSARNRDWERDAPWFLAFVDRSRRPETEVWIFGNWETTMCCEGDDGETMEEGALQREQLMLAFAETVSALPLPTSIHVESRGSQGGGDSNGRPEGHKADDVDFSGTSREQYAAHAADPSIVLCGAIHEATAGALQRAGLVRKGALARPCHAYVFDLDSAVGPSMIPTDVLPEGLRWGQLEKEDFVLVRARTQIPRQDRTLAVLPNMAIIEDRTRKPISWAFIGLDGSLSTLHVEAEWRGRGLAKMIAARLLTRAMSSFWENGVARLAHGDVIVGNTASCRVCKSVGGTIGWLVYWLRMDVSNFRGR